MVRSTPPSDWVAYVVVGLVVAFTMLGKYLIAKVDQPIDEVIKEDLEEFKHFEEKIEHQIEERLEQIK